DSGGSWALFTTRLSRPTRLILDAKDPSILYGGGSQGVFKSVDGGATWRSSNSGLIATDIFALAIDPQSPHTIYSATQTEGGSLAKSVDSGENWSAVGSGMSGGITVTALAVDPRNSDVVYAMTNVGPPSSIFKSADRGATWRNTGLPMAASALAVDLQSPATLYAAGQGSVF